jgi:hypothetical protein
MNRNGIFLMISLAVMHASWPADEMRCNGDAILCDRRYNDIAQISSHDATSYGFSPVQDQDEDIEQQLAHGIRVFKIPLHYDFENRLGYYDALIRSYLKELNGEIRSLEKEMGHKKTTLFMTFEDKKREVKKLDDEIKDTQRNIDEKNRWFDSLPKFSLTGNSKVLRALDYASAVGALEIKKGFLIAAKETALKALEVAQKAGDVIVSRDTRLDMLRIRKKLLEEAALPLTSNHGERTIFSCHALPKFEIYSDFVGQLITAAPAVLKPILEIVLKPLASLYQKGVRTLYGNTDDTGGLFPYPACLLDTSAMSLEKFLGIIKTFLDTNPHEVVTILLNEFVSNEIMIADIFQQSGILHYTYAQDRDQPWPTLRELINNNKRLIVFIDEGGPDRVSHYKWLNNRKFYTSPWPMNYGFKSVEPFVNLTTPLTVFGDVSYRDRAPYNKIFGISHTVTPTLAANKNDAERINALHVSLPFFTRISEAAERIPTWISADFIQHPPGDLMKAVSILNHELYSRLHQEIPSAEPDVSVAERQKIARALR